MTYRNLTRGFWCHKKQFQSFQTTTFVIDDTIIFDLHFPQKKRSCHFCSASNSIVNRMRALTCCAEPEIRRCQLDPGGLALKVTNIVLLWYIFCTLQDLTITHRFFYTDGIIPKTDRFLNIIFGVFSSMFIA